MKRRDFIRIAASASCAALGIDAVSARSIVETETSSNDDALLRNVTRRELIDFAYAKGAFAKGKGDVAFLGGSITEMEGYRPLVCEYLQKRFPKTEFNFIAAGISSTCSDVGAFRLKTDVLSKCEKGWPDLFFVEFAVNDDQDGVFPAERARRGMEGIVRHVKRLNPRAAIVMSFFVNEHIMASYREGAPTTSIRQHDEVAKRYGVSTVNIGKEIQEQIDAGKITWEEFGGVHPAPRGNRICADMITGLLERAWTTLETPGIGLCGTRFLPEPLDPFSYSDADWRGFDGVTTNVGKITDSTSVADGGFRLYVPDWSKIKGSFRNTFSGVPCLCAEKPGAEATFEFDGNAAGLYILAGPDAGIVECQIDGGEFKKIDSYHHYSRSLHYPCALLLADALSPGKHAVKLRVSSEKNANSAGTALRIMQIAVNRPEK